MKASLMVIERDDGVIIPGVIDEPDFRPIELELGDRVSLEDINTDNVVMLESEDNERIRFEFWPLSERTGMTEEQWNAKLEEYEGQEWMFIGFDALRYYPSIADYKKTLDE